MNPVAFVKAGRRTSRPRPGGEPLGKVAVLSDGSRRLPGITQRKACRGDALGRGSEDDDEDEDDYDHAGFATHTPHEQMLAI